MTAITSSYAQGTEELSLKQALQQAVKINQQLAIAESRVEEAQGQRTQAGLKPNPRLTLQTEDIRPSENNAPFSYANSTEDYLLIGQVIETAGKRKKRIAAASSVERSQQAQRDLEERQVISRVSASYWAAASAARLRDLAQQNLGTYDNDVNYSQNRVHEGFMAEADLMRIKVERNRANAEWVAAKRDADQAAIELYRAIGRVDFPNVRFSDSLETQKSVTAPELALALQRRPELLVAREAVTEAEANLRLQKAIAHPDPEAFVGYKRNVGYDTAYFALQMDLPFRNRNQGNIASAEARLKMAAANQRAVEAAIRADIRSAERAYEDQRTLLANLPDTVALAQQSERLARAAYREGAIELLRLLDAERSRIMAETDYYRALADLRQRAVALNLATGADLLEAVGP